MPLLCYTNPAALGMLSVQGGAFVGSMPPPPTLAQSKWKYHTYGGKCIYCGVGCITPSHLEQCEKYKMALEEEELGDDNQQGKYDVVAQSSPPGYFFGADIGCTTTKLSTPPGHNSAKETTPIATNEHPRSAITIEVTPIPTTAPPQKKARTNQGGSPFAYSCLACGQMRCPYDNGFTVLMEGEDEFDPDGYLPRQVSSEQENTHPHLLLPFPEINNTIRLVVAGIVESKGVWSAHKYIGNPRLDSKLKTWMRNRLPEAAIVDSPTWIALRHSVKETFRYKRQRCVHLIRTRFMRELPLSMGLTSSVLY